MSMNEHRNIILAENTIYEIDEECMLKRKVALQEEQNNQISNCTENETVNTTVKPQEIKK